MYNNFPWPDITESQRTKIETLAGAILEVRRRYPDSSLADLYDPLTMPSDLLRAHRELDKAVDLAYRKESFANDEDRLSFLFGLYEKLTK